MAQTRLAQAYVQIMPTTKGIGGMLKSGLEPEADKAGASAGEKAGASLVSKLKGLIAAAGIGTFIKQSLDAGGAIQQSFGGLDTLYEGASEAAKNYALQAAEAGISANSYAEQAVSFGAALKSAFSGDVAAAAEAANTAILDMADNSAKMGTDLESVQAAYQGFAKGQYTLLDNLKLGYGGTKGEMERLLQDAEKFSGVKYDINNLGDVYEAIHVVQGELGISGVAAAEAATTFSGSFGAMKAAAENFMAALSAEEMDVTPALDQLISSAETFLIGNLFPMIGRIASSIPSVLNTVFVDLIPDILEMGTGMIESLTEGVLSGGDGFAEGAGESIRLFLARIEEDIPLLIMSGLDLILALTDGIFNGSADAVNGFGSLLDDLIENVTWYLPQILDKGIEIITNLANGFVQNFPAVMTAITDILVKVITFIGSNMPAFLDKGYAVLTNMAKGIIKNIPTIVSSIAQTVARLLATLAQYMPQILQKGIEIIGKIVTGIINSIPKIPGAIARVISSITSAFRAYDFGSLGRNIITGIKNGIVNAGSQVITGILGVCKNAFNAVKSFFNIASPSRLMRDMIGKNIALGMANGILGEVDTVSGAMEALSEASVGMIDTNVSVSHADRNSGKMLELMGDLIEAVEQGKTIKLDNREVGRMVRSFA